MLYDPAALSFERIPIHQNPGTAWIYSTSVNRFKEHRLAKAAGYLSLFSPDRAKPREPSVTIDGRRIIMAGSNNYLV